MSVGWILGVTSSASPAGLALFQGNRLEAERRLGGDARRGAGLVPAARDLLAAAGVPPRSLSLVAVDAGPGSFTGVRIAVAFGKALAFAAACPAAAVSSLEARAADASAEGRTGLMAVALDARRGRFYGAIFRAEGGRVARLLEDALMTAEALHDRLDRLPGAPLWLGDAGPALVRPGEEALPERAPSPEAVVRLGLSSARVLPVALAPAYHRGIEAQERRRA